MPLFTDGVSFGTPALLFSTTNAAGVAGTALRTDATFAVFDTTAPVTQNYSDVAATGVSGFAARRDHVHGMPAAGGGALTAQTLSPSSSQTVLAGTAVVVVPYYEIKNGLTLELANGGYMEIG